MEIVIRGGVNLDIVDDAPRVKHIDEDTTARVLSYDGVNYFTIIEGVDVKVWSDQILDPVEVNKFEAVKREVRRRAEDRFEREALSAYNHQMGLVDRCKDLEQLQLYYECEVSSARDEFARLVFDTLK
jgi:hypothetical protein